MYIESGNDGLLIDAGLSERELSSRLAAIGRSAKDLKGVFLTHEHSDHVRGVGALARKHKIPVFSTEGTYRKIKDSAGELPDWRPFKQEDGVTVGGLRVESYPTEHDAEEPVAFVVLRGSLKLGHATDLGKVTPIVRERLSRSQALLVESNHDIDMLDAGPYPWPLKQRIKSDVGHLSNEACADLLSHLNHDLLQHVVLMHLSETNNHRDIAHITAAQALGGNAAKMILACQDRPTPLITIH
ncbi:MAG: MBL fold metallo-hydrolase [Nitrospinae bacterium]|nr:MBL fold metallo-hydrolase [Nitrospinota bacterium]